LRQYQSQREQNEYELENRKKEIYNYFPEIKHIDEQINQICLKLAKLVLEKPKDREKIVQKSKDEINFLKNKKSQIFSENNIPLDYLELKYNCDICKDKAFLDSGEKCNCFKQKIIKETYKMSNIEDVLQRENFSTFNLNVFPDNISTNVDSENNHIQTKSQRENMKSIHSKCIDYVNNFAKKNNRDLLFTGSTGLGKTFLCNCIAKELLDRGYLVIYQTAFTIIEILEDYKFRRNNFNNNDDNVISEENYRNLFNCDLLIIDDLGTEMINSFTKSEIFNIVNTRMIACKSTIISTNLNIVDILNFYGQRTLSRVIDNCNIIEFYGKDLRLK
jgi:DNA replication protein DnaC